MARHAKKSDRSAAIRTYLGAGITAGVAGAALAGVGALTLIDDAQAPTEIQVQLVSNEEELLFLSLNGGSDRKEAASTSSAPTSRCARPSRRGTWRPVTPRPMRPLPPTSGVVVPG